MAVRPGLVPTPTTDKNGKQTTVYRRENRRSAATAVPPPVIAPSEPVEAAGYSYAEHLAAIAEGNARWRAGEHPQLQAMQALLLRPEHIGVLHRAIASSGYERDSKDLVQRIDTALERQSYATLMAAARYGWVYSAMKRNPGLGQFDTDAFQRERARGERFETRYVTEVLKVANQLQRFDLMPKYEAPDKEEVMRPGSRLLAHLWARAHDSHYLRRGDADRWIRLIDEFPWDAHYIVERAEAGQAPDTVAAVLGGEIARPLGDGAL